MGKSEFSGKAPDTNKNLNVITFAGLALEEVFGLAWTLLLC
jgi:hypothetical protein